MVRYWKCFTVCSC